MQTVSPACTHTTHNCIAIIFLLLDLQNMTIKHPLDLSMLIKIYILPSAHVIQTFLVINQTHTPLDYLSRPDKSVPCLRRRRGEEGNLISRIQFCVWLDSISPFFIAFGIILQRSLSKDFRALHRYYLITICRGMKCFSQGQSATHGRVCIMTAISRLQSHSVYKRLISFSWGKRGDALIVSRPLLRRGREAAVASPADAGERRSSLGTLPKTRVPLTQQPTVRMP